MSSNTKVIHLRLEKEEILSLIEYFEKYCAVSKADTPPIATVISQAIVAVCYGLRERKVLDTHLSHEVNVLYTAAASKYKRTKKPKQVQPVFEAMRIPEVPEISDPHVDLSDIPEQPPVNSYIREQTRQNIEEIIGKITQPGIELDLTKFEVDASDLPIGTFNFRQADKVERKDLPQSNKFVMKTADLEGWDKEAYLEALCISFYNLADVADKEPKKFETFLTDVFTKVRAQMKAEHSSGGLDMNL